MSLRVCVKKQYLYHDWVSRVSTKTKSKKTKTCSII